MNYFVKLFSTGAIRKTPQSVIESMVQAIGSRTFSHIVEIGAGKGELTEAVLNNGNRHGAYYVFEIDDSANAFLKKKFADITIVNGNAFAFMALLPPTKTVDLFISSIPLSFYPRKKVRELLENIKQVLSEDGTIIIIFSAFWLIPLLKRQFAGSRIYTFFTFPPYFLFVYNAK